MSFETLATAIPMPLAPEGEEEVAKAAAPRFVIGEQDFLLDGAPFVIRCGEIHFPRVPREYWRHRLRMCRALGLNAVCVYLFWNFHEWEEGKYDWSGPADAAEFCRMAQEEGLWVLLRPGPYSCAEWEMGGLPWWLTKREGIGLRSIDPRFLEPATAFLREVGRVLGSQQITRGGPLLMVQVENEYGSFGRDAHYMGALRQALIEGGFDVPLFACNPTGDLANGHRSDLFQVVNFGAGAAREAFRALRRHQPTGPLMNGEYYPAWFDMWGRKHRTGPIESIVSDLEYMLENRHSFSIYMAHGGTSFGLWAGADRPFSPDTTSYDYDAPISEAGWQTPKFEAIRSVMARYLQPGETLPSAPAANPVIEIPPFSLQETAPVFENLPAPFLDDSPRPMEAYDQSRGAILYRTNLSAGPACALTATAVHDFAWAYLDGEPVGVLDRRNGRFHLDLPLREAPARLDLLVYAMGRVNFGEQVFDQKGLHGPVEIKGEAVKGWEVFCLPLDGEHLQSLRYGPPERKTPAFWRGSFELDALGDTFLDVGAWGKGVVWINGRPLGRFWNIGPTQTLYVPAPWLKKGRNEVVVLDFLGPRNSVLRGIREPILDDLHPELDFARPTRASGRFVPSTPLAEGSFSGEVSWQCINFASSAEGRYLCLEGLSALDGGSGCAVAGLDAFDPQGAPLPRAAWNVLWVSSEETNYLPGHAENAIDGQTSTFWHSETGDPKPPHRLIVDLGETRTLGGIRYLPRSGDAQTRGRIRDFRIYLSDQPFGLQPTP
jgi:beta-galactosidase